MSSSQKEKATYWTLRRRKIYQKLHEVKSLFYDDQDFETDFDHRTLKLEKGFFLSPHGGGRRPMVLVTFDNGMQFMDARHDNDYAFINELTRTSLVILYNEIQYRFWKYDSYNLLPYWGVPEKYSLDSDPSFEFGIEVVEMAWPSRPP